MATWLFVAAVNTLVVRGLILALHERLTLRRWWRWVVQPTCESEGCKETGWCVAHIGGSGPTEVSFWCRRHAGFDL